MIRSSVEEFLLQIAACTSLKTRKRRTSHRRTGSVEHFESRLMLSAVTFEAGALTFHADANSNDEVEVSAPDANTLVIDVGNQDSISLSGAAAGNANLVLSNNDSVLTVNVANAGVTSAQINLGNEFDTLTVSSLPQNVEFSADGGEGDDVLDASAANESVILVGGTGNDTLLGGTANDALFGGSGNDELRGGDGDDNLVGGGQIEITITNLQQADGALLTPFFLSTTNGVYDFFDVDSASSASLERLAEDGNVGPRISAALNSGGVNQAIATSGGPLAPGESRTLSLLADSLNELTQYLSFASMVIPSNDAFIGNDDPREIDLFDANGELIRRTDADAFIVTGDDVYDAGTEVNDEIPENTAALAQAAPNTGVTENGVIRQHEGFQGSQRLGGATGNVLAARPNADFTVPGSQIASIQIENNDGDDLLIGGRGNDVLRGGDGNDTLIGGFGDDELDGGNGDDELIGGGQIEVTVTNLQQADGALLTPFFLATQDGVYDFFDVGGTASGSLEQLAEDGAVGGRIDAAINSGGVGEALATPGGPIQPGDSRTVTFYANNADALTRYLSFASMVIPSNDAFIGNDDPLAIDLFDADGNLIQRVGEGAFIVTGDSVYDAGTEVNDEVPENTAALAQAAPNTGVTENGIIRQHEGFQGSQRLGGATGNILTARPNADFTIPGSQIASIQIGTTLDGNDILRGGAGNDRLSGTEGDDTLIGGEGDDFADGGVGNDVIHGDSGFDQLSGGDGDDTVVGGSDEDVLFGDAGNDTLIGGFGDDLLEGGDGDDKLIGGGQIEVTVTNLQQADGALLTPFFLATQNGVYDFFDVGGASSASLERLAEDGAVGPRIEAALNSGGVGAAQATGGGPIQPGSSRTVTFYADSTNDLTQYLSFASMVIPSNDAFIGNDDPLALDLFDAAGNLIQRVGDGAVIITGEDVYDAGTEVNDEVPSNTAALAQAAPDTGVTENGVIRQHEGFQGSERLGGATGNILTARPNADFTLPGAEVASIQVTSLDGDDILVGGAGDDLLQGNEGDDVLEGGIGDDELFGGVGDDDLLGDEGDDLLAGGSGTDTIDGGEGLDTNSFAGIGLGVTATVNADGTGTASYGAVNEAFTGIENLTGSDNDDVLTAVGGGVHILDGGQGNDLLNGGPNTTLIGGEGADTTTLDFGTSAVFLDVFSSDGELQLIERFSGARQTVSGFEQLVLETGDLRDVFRIRDVAAAGVQRLTINAGAGDNFVNAWRADVAVDVTTGAGRDVVWTGTGDDNIFTGLGNDIVWSNTGNDVIDAGEGHNRIFAGDGNDTVTTGAGRDIIRSGSGDDRVDAGDGNNVVFGERGDDTVTTGSGRDWVSGGYGNDVISVGAGNDIVHGNNGDDVLNGDGGDDWLLGGQGNDLLRGGDGNDRLKGHAGNDILLGNAGNDRLFGGGGRDLLFAGTGLDTLFGGSDDDILHAAETLLSEEELELVRDEWTSNRSYEERLANITGDGAAQDRLNGTAFVNAATSADDSERDRLFGQFGLDAYFASIGDRSFARRLESLFDL